MEAQSWRIYSILLVLTVALCYYNSLQCGFVFDDISAIRDNKDLRPTNPVTSLLWNDFWGTPMNKEHSHKSYRPLCVFTFRLNYLLHELEPMGYHLVNVILHAVVCVMYLRVCNMFLPELASFIAALFFAVHPIHTEAVTGVVGRAEALSSIFFLAAFVSYSKCAGRNKKTDWHRLWQSIAMVAIAMLCKEQGITIIGVCCVYEVFVAQRLRISDFLHLSRDWLRGKLVFPANLKEALLRITVLIGTTFFLLLLRVKLMGGQLPVFTNFDNPASASATPIRQLTYNYLLAVNSWLLLFPCDLCCDWTMGTIPLIESVFDIRNLTTIAFYLGLVKLIHCALFTDGRTARAILMSLAFMSFPFFPASNLFFPVGFVVAERILYAPSLGFCMLVALGWNNLFKRGFKSLAWFGIVFLIITHAARTIIRNYDWETEYTIFQAGLKVNQWNAKLFNNVGHALENDKRWNEALDYFKKAVSVQPDDIGAHINVGRTYNNLKRYKEAEEAYRKAKDLLPKPRAGQTYHTRIAPNHLNVFVNLANLIAKNQSRLHEADALYRQAISMRADYTQAYINRGDVLLKLNRTKEAQETYEKALQYDKDNPDIYYNLGVVHLEQGKTQSALAYLDKALQIDPEHQQALMNSAMLLQESGNAHVRPEAVRRLKKLLQKDKSNERIYFSLGMLAMDDKDSKNAELWFKQAIQIKEDFRSALFNLALLITEDKRPLEALPFLKQLLKFYPDHLKGLILLGDIYVNAVKDLDAAEECYENIIKIDPKNIQAAHNLCVVQVERGHLEKAETCLENVAKLAPNEEYIKKHLIIVRGRIREKRNEQQQKANQKQQQNKTEKPKS